MLDRFDNQRGNWFDTTRGEAGSDPSSERETTGAAALRCAQCRHVLAAVADIISINGKAEHARVNPAGIAFRLRTVSRAGGCAARGAAERAHSWFPPLAWRVASCAACGVHVGWQFVDHAVTAFFALIRDRLVEEE